MGGPAESHTRSAHGRGAGGYEHYDVGGLLESTTELRLPAEPIAPALARAGIRGMTPDLSDRTAADLALLTTEVVSNAVRHASGTSADEITVRLTADDVIRVEVVDCGAWFDPPQPREPWDARASGWGLFLVDSVARAWGIEEEGNGKKVWFEIDRVPESTTETA